MLRNATGRLRQRVAADSLLFKLRHLDFRGAAGDRSHVEKFFSVLWKWLLERVPNRQEGYTLDLDSTVFERYGKQEGARKGYNPRKPGRVSHHPLLAVLNEATMIVHGWLRSGNSGTSQGVVNFLREALAKLPSHLKITAVRADSGFFDQKLLGFLEEQTLSYVIFHADRSVYGLLI